MLGIIKRLFGPSVDLAEKLRQGAVIIDVRSQAEFNSGHPKGAKHIPLDKISMNTQKIKNFKQPIITCCASGMRSGSAAAILRKNGIEVYNGGPWQKVERLQNQKSS